MLNEMEFGAFVSLMGDENAARSWLKRNAEGINRLIDEEEIVTRSVDEDEEAEPEVEAQVEQEPEEVVEEVERAEDQPEPEIDVVEIGDEVIDAVVKRLADSDALSAFFHQINERLEAIDHAIASLGVVTEKERSKLAARLEELERDDDEKFVEMLEDLPRKQRVGVTFRPSANTNDDVPASMEHRAESAIAALGDDALYPKS